MKMISVGCDVRETFGSRLYSSFRVRCLISASESITRTMLSNLVREVERETGGWTDGLMNK